MPLPELQKSVHVERRLAALGWAGLGWAGLLHARTHARASVSVKDGGTWREKKRLSLGDAYLLPTNTMDASTASTENQVASKCDPPWTI